jgi:iron complex transport system ATP-binding protein
MIACRNITLVRGGRPVVENLSVDAPTGQMLALLGPNGAGKSSLLSAMTGVLRPRSGMIEINGHSLRDLHPRMLASIRAVLPQNPIAPSQLTVDEVVGLNLGPWIKADRRRRITQALALVNCDMLAHREFGTLSGGQQRLVHLARILAQIDVPTNPGNKIVLLDEPLAGLDPARQEDIMAILRNIARQGASVIVVLHEINHALNWADRVALMRDGRIREYGTARAALTPRSLRATYGVDGQILEAAGRAFYCPIDRVSSIEAIAVD